MPQNAIDFSQTIIYRLVCNDISITETYIGHTTNFNKRKSKHKSNCNNENSNCYNSKVYAFIRSNGGFENWSMLKIEDYPCKDIHEATNKERHWIEHYQAGLNSNIPARTQDEIIEHQKQYREENKEKHKEYKRRYRNENKEHIQEYHKTYFEENKEHIKQYQQQYIKENEERLKKQAQEYYQQNKEKRNQYLQENKERIKAYQKEYRLKKKLVVTEK
jgi:hypothetical protein